VDLAPPPTVGVQVVDQEDPHVARMTDASGVRGKQDATARR
jgi:hypothetical protein